MTTYMVCDGHGNALTDGLQEYEAESVAQLIANTLWESVWLSASDSEDMDEFEPEDGNPVGSARAALEDWDSEDEDEIGEVFAAIYGGAPSDDEDAFSMIFAAVDVLTVDEAKRVLAVLG